MLKDEFLEKIVQNKTMQEIPIVYSAKLVSSIEEVLEDFGKENPYATVSELFADE